MLVSVALFSGFTRLATVPAGNLPKAASVGANTVNGPLLCRVSTRPAALTAATSVVWSLEFTAFSTIFLEGYMAAPPTVVVSENIPAIYVLLNRIEAQVTVGITVLMMRSY